MKHLSKLFFSIIIIISFSSCGDDAVTPVTNDPQNEGPVQTQEGTPIGMPVFASISPAGGSLMDEDSTLELSVPPGALNTTTNITMQPVTNQCPGASGDIAYRFSPVQFNDSVSLKFKYNEDADGRFLSAAVQTSGGYWKNARPVTVDTVNKTMTVKVKSIGSQTDAGGGDIASWEYIKIFPRRHVMRVNETINLIVRNTAPNDDEELQNLPPTVTSWTKDGPGELTPNNSSALYKSPGTIPQPNTIKVYAVARHGNENVQVQSDIKIIDNVTKYHLKMNMVKDISSFSGYPSTLTDGADMDVTVTMGNPPSVAVENIVDRVPIVTPPDYNIPNNQGHITWLPDGYGLINISSVVAFVTSLSKGDVEMSFAHANTLVPKFRVDPTWGSTYYLGGTPIPGSPPILNFHNNGEPQTFVDLTHNITVIITVIE